MNAKNHFKPLSFLIFIASAVFIWLMVVSVLWYKERVLYVDSAYYAFNMINKGLPWADHHRYALYLYQLLPWIMLKLNFDIPSVLRMYSFSHIFIHFVVFFLLLRMKKPGHAILLALMQVLPYRDCFFLTVNETSLVITSGILLAALIEKAGNFPNPVFRSIMYFICILVAVFSHPIAALILPFIIVYQLIRFRPDKTIRKAGFLALGEFIACMAIRWLATKSSGYENDLYEQLFNSPQIISHLSEIYSFNFFFGNFKLNSHFFSIYFIPLSLFLLFAIFKFVSGKTSEGFYYVISCIGMWLITVIMFNRGDGNIFMEKNFTPWIFLVLTPLAGIKYNGLKAWIPALLYSAICLFSIKGIYRIELAYNLRLFLVDRLITEKNPSGAPKLILQDSTVDHEKWLGIWALPYETLLMSKIKHIKNTTAKIYHNEEHIRKELDRTDIFIGADFIPVFSDTVLLNPSIFKLEEMAYLEVKDP